MLRAQTDGTAETYCEHAGPYVMLSYSVESLSRRSGDVHRLCPAGGCKV